MISHDKQELSPQTMKILIYIDRHSPTQEKLGKRFSKSPLFSERMKELQQCNPQLVLPHLPKDGIPAYFTSSSAGKRLVEDFLDKERISRKELWLKNAWIPILVSIATTLAINVLKSLWPLIQQWASNFL